MRPNNMRVEVMSTREILETLVKEKAPGPTSSFQIFHIIKALELISHAPVGRGGLAKKLGIGEGATRTLIERLKDEQIISISKSGCTLTKKGEQLWKRIERIIPSKIKLEQSKLTLSAYNVAILVQGKASKVKLGMEQRDAAFLAGAKGATTLVMKKGKLTMPCEDVDIKETVPETRKKIISFLKPREDDVIIIGSADTYDLAEYGAIAAAWTLLDDNA
jgi:predicted transcriptional regulator